MPITVTQELADAIIARAKDSPFGLNPAVHPWVLDLHKPHDFDNLSLALMTSWEDKFDHVSLLAAAMAEIYSSTSPTA